MKSTSFIWVALITYTAYVLPAAEQTPSSWQDNPLLAKTVACVIGTDNRAIVGFYQTLPADPILYPNGPTHGNHFGFAIVATGPTVSKGIHENITVFAKRYRKTHHFIVNDTQSLSLEMAGSRTELITYTAAQCLAKRYVMLCSHTSDNLRVKKIVEKRGQKDKPELDFTAMLAFVKEQLPHTTFVLFDAATYEEERAMHHIPESMKTMLIHAAIARKKSPAGHDTPTHKKSMSLS